MAGAAGPVAGAGRGRAGRGGGGGRSAGGGNAGGDGPFEAGQPVVEGGGRVVELRSGEPDERDLEDDPRVRRVAHVDLDAAEHLDAPDEPWQAEPSGPVGQERPLVTAGVAELRGQRGQERLAELVDELRGELRRSPAGLVERGDRDERSAGVLGLERVDQLVDLRPGVVGRAGRGDLVEERERVAGRAAAAADRDRQGVVVEGEAGRVVHVVQEAVEDVGPEQPELEVLGAAADRRRHLLRVRRREHEDDVARRLLERLQQRVRGRVREHVDLVDDVDLPPARRPERGVGDQVADGVDAVVRRRVELVDVERRAAGDLHAGRADAARLAVLRDRRSSAPGRGCGPSTSCRCRAAR